jgi:hypothetical protein
VNCRRRNGSSPSLTLLFPRVEIALFIKTRRDALDFHRPATFSCINLSIDNTVKSYLFILQILSSSLFFLLTVFNLCV